MNTAQQNVLALANLVAETGREIQDIDAQIAELEARRSNKMTDFVGYSEQLAMALAAAAA